jgi:hypothetical protein
LTRYSTITHSDIGGWRSRQRQWTNEFRTKSEQCQNQYQLKSAVYKTRRLQPGELLYDRKFGEDPDEHTESGNRCKQEGPASPCKECDACSELSAARVRTTRRLDTGRCTSMIHELRGGGERDRAAVK